MVNNILNKFDEELEQGYKYLLVDNEAGMEHLSQRTSGGKVDILIMVTDYALRGLRAVKRIKKMLPELKLDVKNISLVVNRAPEKLNAKFLEEVEEIGVPIICTIPEDTCNQPFDISRVQIITAVNGNRVSCSFFHCSNNRL